MAPLDAVAETDLAVAALSGGTIQEYPTHLVIRTPANPTYHWGNFLQVTDETLAGDPAACVDLFRQEFPKATWIAIGLPGTPRNPKAWTDLGIGIQAAEALSLAGRPRRAGLPFGYSARQLQASDWEASAELAIRENDRTGEFPSDEYGDFARKQALLMGELTEAGKGAWSGAFANGVLVSDLGIVDCGRRARYRSVGTDSEHRGRGLASHLLGLAADWALERGCTELVIVTETTNPAGRLYRRSGFEPISGSVAALPPLTSAADCTESTFGPWVLRWEQLRAPAAQSWPVPGGDEVPFRLGGQRTDCLRSQTRSLRSSVRGHGLFGRLAGATPPPTPLGGVS